MGNTVDSNSTELRIAEEKSIKVLPTTPIWYPCEPNGFADMGGTIKTVSRNPINPSRQRQKGAITDLDASAGWGQDLTQSNFMRLAQGFLFADLREKDTTAPINGTAIALTGVVASTKTISAASGLGVFTAGQIVVLSGFTNAGNNGKKTVASCTATTLVLNETMVDETPTSSARVDNAGVMAGAGDLNIVAGSGFPQITSTTLNFTTLGLVAGEFIFIGGDTSATKFANPLNNGFARIRSIAAHALTLDKTDHVMVSETGTGLTVQLFTGNVLKNEKTANLIKRRTYQAERILGQDDNGTMSEYVTGAVPNELKINLKQADKVTMDFAFVACDHELRDGTVGVKSGTRPTAVTGDACFNTSSDFSRLKLHKVVAGDACPNALFSYLSDMTLTVNNNVEPQKALAVLGAFDASVGTFEVSATATAYFHDTEAVSAVRSNADVSLDLALAKDNAGYVIDIPLVSLGGGNAKVEQDKPITVDLSADAAEGEAGHTLLITEFPYLPSLAQ